MPASLFLRYPQRGIEAPHLVVIPAGPPVVDGIDDQKGNADGEQAGPHSLVEIAVGSQSPGAYPQPGQGEPEFGGAVENESGLGALDVRQFLFAKTASVAGQKR